MLNSRIRAGDFPSAVYVVSERGRVAFADALGDAVREPEQHAATLETIYDLASLTKPLITGLLCARLVELGELTLDSSVANYVGEFDRPDKNEITVRELLTHTSGLPSWKPLYLLSEAGPEGALAAIASQTLTSKPGERAAYGDLGFIVLGFLLERLTGKRLDMLAQEEIFNPLALGRTFFKPPSLLKASIAASENGRRHERQMCEDEAALVNRAAAAPATVGAYVGWPEGLIWGEVHDGNAHFLGGVSGHAGLFSTAAETLRLAEQCIAERSALLQPETCALFRRKMTPGPDEARSFAWQLAETKASTAGPSLPPDAFGHTGFTGTSCWVDSPRQRVLILLTNRTHAHDLPFANINAVRREFHTLAVTTLDQI